MAGPGRPTGPTGPPGLNERHRVVGGRRSPTCSTCGSPGLARISFGLSAFSLELKRASHARKDESARWRLRRQQ